MIFPTTTLVRTYFDSSRRQPTLSLQSSPPRFTPTLRQPLLLPLLPSLFHQRRPHPHPNHRRRFFATSSNHFNRDDDLPNFYYVLDVAPDADDKQIKQSYLRLAKKYHPDVNKQPNADELFKTLQQAYEVLSNKNDRAFYDQIRGVTRTAESGVPMPPGYHMHPAYVARKEYEQGSRNGRRNVYGMLDVLFSRRGMYILLLSPILVMGYFGVSTLGLTKSQAFERDLQRGMLSDGNVVYANMDKNGNIMDQGTKMVPAFWHDKKRKWLRPESWTKIQQIGAGRQLTMVREYKTRDEWEAPKDYTGPDTERALKEKAAEHADLLGLPREKTDREKEVIVLARLAERREKQEERLKERKRRERMRRRTLRKKEAEGVTGRVTGFGGGGGGAGETKKKRRQWGLPAPK